MKLQWTTYDGRVFNENTITHQHISNIIWFRALIWEDFRSDLIEELEDILKDKYNDVLLGYYPDPNFKEEIEFLNNRGYLRWVTVDYAKIIINDNVVGIVKN